MVHIIRDRRLLPTFVALAVTAFLVIPMIMNANVVRAQSVEDEDPCEDVPESQFEDRDRVDPAHLNSVDCVDFYGITSGSGENGELYLPKKLVTREQMATFIVNTLEAAGLGDRLPSGNPPDEFDDIEDSAHRGNINKLARAGIVRGQNGSYDPEGDVRRDEMASFILQAYEWAYQEDFSSSQDYYGDVDPGNVHFGNINAAYEEGLVRGVEEPDNNQPNSGTYDPTSNVQREAMASFLVNLLAALRDAPEEFCTEPTSSPSPSSSASPQPSSSASPTSSASPQPSSSASASPSSSASPRPSSSASASPTASATPCATQSGSPTPRPSSSATASPRPSGSASPTSTASPTGTASPTSTASPTATASPCVGIPPICIPPVN